ncbi:phosphatase PAP2 family protein [Phytohabitans flavus]|uniref:phosphatase PAP2 family protein n=1 Tax=Phytohabitans flavus TaxID=1076124 RepID=UPI00363B9876
MGAVLGATARLANLYYVGVHFPGTIAAMVWLWVRHRPDYLRMRTEMAVLTGAALFVHVIFPLAPPRLVSGFGMVDTMISTGPSAYPDSSTAGWPTSSPRCPRCTSVGRCSWRSR